MPTASFVIGLIFVGLGTWWLVTRLLHQCYLGEFWNNTPLPITWGVTIMFAGAAVAGVGFATSFQKCDYGCVREGGNTAGSTMVAGGIVVLVGLSMRFCCTCLSRKPEEIYYDWGTGEDNRGAMSGVDFVALAIGLAIFATEEAMGTCPQSCAEAVVLT